MSKCELLPRVVKGEILQHARGREGKIIIIGHKRKIWDTYM